MTQRWNEDGTENQPPAECAEFHLLPTKEAFALGMRPFSLFLKKGQRLIYRKRRHADNVGAGPAVIDRVDLVTHLVGFEEDHDYAHFSCYAQLLPDGRVEWSSDYNHITEHERNLDAEPARVYERWNP